MVVSDLAIDFFYGRLPSCPARQTIVVVRGNWGAEEQVRKPARCFGPGTSRH